MQVLPEDDYCWLNFDYMTLMPLSGPSDGGEFGAIERVLLFNAGESIDDPLSHGYRISFLVNLSMHIIYTHFRQHFKSTNFEHKNHKHSHLN